MTSSFIICNTFYVILSFLLTMLARKKILKASVEKCTSNCMKEVGATANEVPHNQHDGL